MFSKMSHGDAAGDEGRPSPTAAQGTQTGRGGSCRSRTWPTQSQKQRIQIFKMHKFWCSVFFFERVGIFNLVFLRNYWTKYRCFCDYWKGNFLHYPKLTLLLSLVLF